MASSRTQAQKMLLGGFVKGELQGEWRVLDKPSLKVTGDIELFVTPSAEMRYASRAGLKLELALRALHHQGLLSSPLATCAEGKLALDIGQSTGGFTDCLLQCGASKVVGIDVGHDQLVDKLRVDPRVVCLEGVNARQLPTETLLMETQAAFDWVVMDVSFISQTLILPHIQNVLHEDGVLLSLVKPQFEVGRDGIGKGGIVKSAALFADVEARVVRAAEAHGLRVISYFESGIAGADGNREFFMMARAAR